MATVFLAEDLKHRRRVAIKVLDPEVAAAIGPERFLREIGTVARLTHPHILTLFDSGEAGGLLYFVMPYVEGESLRTRLWREKQLPLDDALRLTREVADALGYAHGQGVVHRDVKPENILLEEGHAVVADFGIARAVAAAGTETLTMTGIMVGTLAYMSPEQAAGSHDVDGRSDQYSLGCMLYEMLAGQPPFTGPTLESLVRQHLSVSPRSVTELRPAVPAAVTVALQRALAKTPADRYATAGEFAAALGRQGGAPTDLLEAATVAARTPPPPAPKPHRMRWVAVAAALAVAITALAVWQQWWPFGGATARPAKKQWILVAEFEGPPDDTTLATAARSLVSAALDQSEILATVPHDQIQLALQQAGKPANTRVSAEVARELAYRRAVRAVLEGDVARIGFGYSVSVRVVDAESLEVVVAEHTIAKNKDALIPALGRLGEKLRRELGDRRSSIAATRPMTATATPSFEAYQLYVRASQLHEVSTPTASRVEVMLLRRALALDPEFASAWFLLGRAYYNLQQPDSVRSALEEALHHPERLADVERLSIEARLGGSDGDAEAQVRAFERILQYSPGSIYALNARAMALEDLGRFDEALESVRLAEAASPFGPSSILLGNETYFLCDMGRTDEARGVAQRIPGLPGLYWLSYAELVACRWAAVESCAAAAMRVPGYSETPIPVFLASAQAGRGAFREAASSYDRAERIGGQSEGSTFHQNKARRGRLLLCVLSGGAIPVPADTWAGDSSTATTLTRGLRAAIARDEPKAQRLLTSARAKPRRDLLNQGTTPVLLEAWILGTRRRWDDVPRVLLPTALLPLERGHAYAAGMSAVRWTLADAYERSGQPDSAVVWLERVTSDPAGVNGDAHFRGAMQSAAHQRLVLLYARMGRLEDAERHLAVLERWWDRPDDIAQHMLGEARAAVVSLRAMAPRRG